MAATARSGSNLLCELLESTNVAGHPDEYFLPPREREFSEQWGVSGFTDYFDAAIVHGTGNNGVFGAKILWFQALEWLATRLRTRLNLYHASTAAVISTAFPNLRYIWITRRDKARQAVSLYRAAQTRVWRSYEEMTGPPRQLTFDFLEIDDMVQRVTDDETAWRSYFESNGIDALHMVYEDLAHAPEDLAIEVLRHLDIVFPEPLQFGERRLQKQADSLSEEWVRRYYDAKERTGQGWTPAPRRLPG